VNHPAVDDFVLGCGGTQITQGKDVVWNDGTPFDVTVRGGGGWATGGGISVVFPVPSYQTGANLPVSIDTGKAGRGVPDIAMSATNYFTRVDSSEGAAGGTSAVAPLMSALISLRLPKSLSLRKCCERCCPRRHEWHKRHQRNHKGLQSGSWMGCLYRPENTGRYGDPKQLMSDGVAQVSRASYGTGVRL
jgi:hypothetical protein